MLVYHLKGISSHIYIYRLLGGSGGALSIYIIYIYIHNVESPCVVFLSGSINVSHYILDPWASQQDIQTLSVAVDAGQVQGRSPSVRHGADEPGAVEGFPW